MRAELINGRLALCGHIVPDDKLAVGLLCTAARGSGTTVRIAGLRHSIPFDGEPRITYVLYEWWEGFALMRYEKDSFSFQCRYCLLLTNPEEMEKYR